jgi:hypothetical protein
MSGRGRRWSLYNCAGLSRKFCQHWTYSRRVLNEAHYGVGGTDRLGRGLDVDER